MISGRVFSFSVGRSWWSDSRFAWWTSQPGRLIPLKQVVGRMIPPGSLEDLSHGWPFFYGEWDCHDDHRIPRSELWTHVVLDWTWLNTILIWGVPEIGDPHIIHFHGNVPYKPSIFGYLHFRKPPYVTLSNMLGVWTYIPEFESLQRA